MATPQPSTPRNHAQGAGRSSKPRQRRPTRWPKPEGAPKARAGIEDELATAFERTVAEGHRRLTRTWPGLLATGAVGGIDISTGILGLLIVHQATNNALLAALAFSIGFIALTLAGSELFTENFLVPIAAVAARWAPARSLARLWAGTAVTNLLGGWVMMGIVMAALPKLRPTAIEIARVYPKYGIGVRSFALALLGGVIITLMTWMERSTTSVPGKLAAASAAAFLLAAGSLNHAIVVSLEMFAALHAGAPFGYLDWLRVVLWATLGNMVGGIGLVTVLRLVQVGRRKMKEEEDKAGDPH
jgi:formate/nitrite transporter FocA (FNT family)